MANWFPLRERLREVEDRYTFAWDELDSLVGGLPRSAYEHSAFWRGMRTGWPGFTTTSVVLGDEVTFVRRSNETATTADGEPGAVMAPPLTSARRPDIVLVSCVKSKLSHPAPARDLYTSSLFCKQRSYAEALGVPWFVLSAKHGLVAPENMLEPYELRLSNAPRDYRRGWGARVVQQLQDAAGPLDGKTIEVHAGAAYTDPIRAGLRAAGADLVEPLSGLPLGQRLAWYRPWTEISPVLGPTPEVSDLVARLKDQATTQSPAEFLSTNGVGLRAPGLYSWWIDHEGAADLTTGLGLLLEPGLIYAGLAGATRSRSGRKSTNTLWGRIRGMHLGGRHQFSTFRLSLGSILAAARGETEIDEERLTDWMHAHLRVIALPVEDADALGGLETAVLAALTPPLNLAKLPKTRMRARLSELRKPHGRGSTPRLEA